MCEDANCALLIPRILATANSCYAKDPGGRPGVVSIHLWFCGHAGRPSHARHREGVLKNYLYINRHVLGLGLRFRVLGIRTPVQLSFGVFKTGSLGLRGIQDGEPQGRF